MQKIKINAVKVNVETDKGCYSKHINFDNGLNIIRAENTSGKSSIINSIFYALGVEIIIGKKGTDCLNKILKDHGDIAGEQFSVLESNVELELCNEKGNVITLRRWFKGAIDANVIEVFDANLLTSPTKKHSVDKHFYYVSYEGAAQREKGFYFFFANYFNLKLPIVARNNGGESPLYIECIISLMAIEQRFGWSSIQSTLPRQYGIRNISKVTIEYLLDLEVFENEFDKERILTEMNQIKEDWHTNTATLKTIATDVGGYVESFPNNISVLAQEEPFIKLLTDGNSISIREYLKSIAIRLEELSFQAEGVGGNKEDFENEIKPLEEQIYRNQILQNKLNTEIYQECTTQDTLHKRQETIHKDIKNNNDVLRLQKLGASHDLNISSDCCPTCRQDIKENLLETYQPPMSIEENIQFLKGEKQAVEQLLKMSDKRVIQMSKSLESIVVTVKNSRKKVRDLKKDAVSSSSISTTLIREQIQLEERAKFVEEKNEDFYTVVEKLKANQSQYRKVMEAKNKLPEDYLSQPDLDKLNILKSKFKNNMEKFGYRSSQISDINISQDNYAPICGDFEIRYDASASDNIRIIWSYILALLEVSFLAPTKHWGFVIFDEPEQQKMKEADCFAFFEKIASLDKEKFQAIITTSADKSDVEQRCVDLDCKIIECNDGVLEKQVRGNSNDNDDYNN